MLILTRHVDEVIRIGHDIEVTVVAIRNNKVRLGVRAPKETPIDRPEHPEAQRREEAAR